MEFRHISVLLDESIAYLNVKPGGTYVDGTLGGGGHAEKVCRILGENGHLIGIDRDTIALEAAKSRLSEFSCRTDFVHDNFFHVKEILKGLEISGIDGGMLDLGVSSPQLDHKERGFSYNQEARLDMRMDQSAILDAYTVVNTYEEDELSRILFTYGEERYAKRIARQIVSEREKAPIVTTTQLSEIVKMAMPVSSRYGDKHPAKRTFQAIRIEVNGELDGLSDAIRDFVDSLKPGGRLAVITFHSLEDRLVKQAFADLAKGCICPREIPVCVCGKKPSVRILTKKPVIAAEDELNENNRAHSAKLRCVEKL